jgi:sugar lactone lactonase YvrE
MMKLPAALLALGLAVIAAPVFGQSYSFTIFAGTPPPIGSRDGTGADARFYNPVAVAVDSAGNTYVADRENAVIRRITAAGVVTTFAGSPGAIGIADGTGAAARFSLPVGVAVDAAGNVFVTDSASHTVRKITPAGAVTTFAGLAGTPGTSDGTGSGARFTSPSGIAIDADGDIYVADTGNRTIRKITAAGVVSTLAGSPGLPGHTDATGAAARFNTVAGIAVDGARNVYVVDTMSHVVRKITPGGTVSTLAGQPATMGFENGVGSAARFNMPFGIAATAGGTLYVADTVNERIRRIEPNGMVSVFAGSSLGGSINGTGGAARFFRPQGVALDSSDNLYVADTFNHSIRKLTPAAVSSTLAGPGGNFGGTDGPAATAKLNRPRGVVLDRQGNLFVTELLNNTIRKITPDGVVTTFAGQALESDYQDASGTSARFGSPAGIAIDAFDTLFVADQRYNAIRRISPAGAVQSWAGTPDLATGSADGPFGIGRFNQPQGVAVDANGTLYVTDPGNHTIRKVLPTTVMSVLAGLGGLSGASDGVGSGARFSGPSDIAIDQAGNLYVTDYNNSTIRKITPAGVVSTLAGQAGARGTADGTGSAARFDNPDGIAVDRNGNVFVSDSNNHTLRRISPAGVVTTIGGVAGVSGVAEGSGSNARFFVPTGITIDPNGVLYVVSSFGNVIMRGSLDATPAITTQPLSRTIAAGESTTFSVAGSGGGLSYQWRLNGAAIAGATGQTLNISNATAASAGDYTVTITNSAGTATSNAARLTVSTAAADAGRIINLAIRSRAGTDDQTLIVGFAISSAGAATTKPVLLRGVGPTLSVFNVPGVLADPRLDLFNSANIKMSENNDWAGNAQIIAIGSQVGAFAFSDNASKDSALYDAAFIPGSYSVQITGTGGTTGVALAEIYDATPAASLTATTPRLTNVSARTQVGTGDDILFAGFVIGGNSERTVLIRAVGPTLQTFGVAGVLVDPRLELFTGSTRINENDNWAGAANLAAASVAVGAFPLPVGSRDAILLVTLQPGSYTAQVSGVGNTTGVALVEVYEMP